MSSSAASARPSQVTVAACAVAGASLVLIFYAFDALSSLNSLAVRDDVSQQISSGGFKGLGWGLADVLEIKRWSLYVSAVAAVVTGVFAVFVLQRDRVARIGVSVAAVPIVVAAPFTDAFLAMFIAAGVVLLWTRQSRDWYAGRPITPRQPSPARRPNLPPPPAGARPWLPPGPDQSSGQNAGSSPAPTHGWGVAPGTAVKDLPPPIAPAPPAQSRYGQWPPPAQIDANAARPASAEDRPRQVRLACILTWVFSGITALGFLVLLTAVVVDQQGLIDLVKANPDWDPAYDDVIVKAAVIGSIVFLLWCAGVSVVAVFAWRGAHWAWVVLSVSTALAGFVAVLRFPYSVVHLAALGITLGLLFSRPARDWFTSRRS
jgi:hypothetical protein